MRAKTAETGSGRPFVCSKERVSLHIRVHVYAISSSKSTEKRKITQHKAQLVCEYVHKVCDIASECVRV